MKGKRQNPVMVVLDAGDGEEKEEKASALECSTPTRSRDRCKQREGAAEVPEGTRLRANAAPPSPPGQRRTWGKEGAMPRSMVMVAGMRQSLECNSQLSHTRNRVIRGYQFSPFSSSNARENNSLSVVMIPFPAPLPRGIGPARHVCY